MSVREHCHTHTHTHTHTQEEEEDKLTGLTQSAERIYIEELKANNGTVVATQLIQIPVVAG